MSPLLSGDHALLWRMAHVIATHHSRRAAVLEAADGIKMVKPRPSNPVGYFRRTLDKSFGKELVSELLSGTPPPRKCPKHDPRKPSHFGKALGEQLALGKESEDDGDRHAETQEA